MPLRLVHLEDDLNDRELIADALRDEGLDCAIEYVASKVDFERAIAQTPDLILADCSMPGFDGISAQIIAHERCPAVPFVFVSGSLGEDVAIERLKNGATDYVLKHRLEKLPGAVSRALREADERRQRARAEDELRALNHELEARVEHRTAQLRAANDLLDQARLEAERANHAKSDFLSRMSHDLRTPLNAIMGFAQVLSLDPLTPEQHDSVSYILHGGRHLLDLINEILDIASIEAGRLSLSPEPVAVDEIVGQAVALIRPLAIPRALTIEVAELPRVHAFADRQRLNQILFNLLSNAVKYNRTRGRVTVTSRRVGDRVSVAVSDTGAGIPPEKMAILFTPFERLGAEQSTVEGTGLGLALAKRLAEAMQGSLTVQSQVDVGTTCEVTLPYSEAAAPRGDVPEQPTQEQITCAGTVVYIEDNASNLRLMQRLIARRPGVELLHAPDGSTGLAMVRELRPGLVFLDLHLPDMPGEEVLRHIWEDPDTRNIPVAVLSADATSAQKRRLLASGARTYLTKPFEIGEVLALFDQVLGRR